MGSGIPGASTEALAWQPLGLVGALPREPARRRYSSAIGLVPTFGHLTNRLRTSPAPFEGEAAGGLTSSPAYNVTPHDGTVLRSLWPPDLQTNRDTTERSRVSGRCHGSKLRI